MKTNKKKKRCVFTPFLTWIASHLHFWKKLINFSSTIPTHKKQAICRKASNKER